MRVRQSIAVAGLALLATVTPLTAAQAATVASGTTAVTAAVATCDQLLARYLELGRRIGVLQYRLQRAGAQDKPDLIRQIVALIRQREAILDEAATQGCDVVVWP